MDVHNAERHAGIWMHTMQKDMQGGIDHAQMHEADIDIAGTQRHTWCLFCACGAFIDTCEALSGALG